MLNEQENIVNIVNIGKRHQLLPTNEYFNESSLYDYDDGNDDDDGDNEHSSLDGGDEHHKSTEIRDTLLISDNYITRFGRTVCKPVRYGDTN